MSTIHEVIQEEATPGKGVHARTQQVFAVKPGVEPLLDVARASYSDAVEKIYAYADEFAASCSVASLKIAQDKQRGFYLVCKATEERSLPEMVISAKRKGQQFQCTTRELCSLNQQFKESLHKVMELTARAVEKVVVAVREEMAALYSISDSIAMLDMLMSFATLVMCQEPEWCKPELKRDTPLAIQGGRHPIVEALNPTSFEPNDTFLQKGSNFHIITGPNMAGKSTYLRQVAIINILGHMGMYVPADIAQLRLTDKILTRLGGDGGIADASGFFMEMRDTSYILENVTETSLVIIDELCRGTSHREGAAIAFAVAEELACSEAYILFTSHHIEMTSIGNNILNIDSYCFSVESTEESGKLAFSHKLGSGACTEIGYGITVAAMQGMPPELIQKAHGISAILAANREQIGGNGEDLGDKKDVHELATILLALRNATLPEADMREYLRELKTTYFATS